MDHLRSFWAGGEFDESEPDRAVDTDSLSDRRAGSIVVGDLNLHFFPIKRLPRPGRPIWAIGLVWLLEVGAVGAVEPGIQDDRILFGQSAAFKGPAAELGIGMRLGIEAAFGEANGAGGIHGRRLELISYNDGYEPEKAIANTERLIGVDEVFALIGEVGTTTSKAAQPLATARGVPFLAPFTGADFLRDPALRNVVNIRASYDQETEAWIRFLVDDLGLTRIAAFYQDDSFGRVGLAGVHEAMEARGMTLVAEATYMRNTTAVKRAVLRIRKGEPQAVVMIGAYRACAEFIEIARGLGMDPTFVNISFVGSHALAHALGGKGTGVIVSQVVPLPDDSRLPLVRRYQRALAALDPGTEPSFVSLEGYIAGRLVIDALERAGPKPTREGLLAAIRDGGAFDIDGLTLAYGPEDNQGLDRVFLTIIGADGRFRSLAQPMD